MAKKYQPKQMAHKVPPPTIGYKIVSTLAKLASVFTKK